VAARLESHLSRRVPGLHDSQFGFRKGRSTADVIGRVRTLVEEAVRRSYVALAVSLDVVNAINSIPWDRIGRALDNAPACTTPSPLSHHSGDTLWSPPSRSDAGTHRSIHVR
jgi:hypothetical protein